MSGHSKWATIKHKKAALDAKRGKTFTRIIKEIMIAARNGGDPDTNPACAPRYRGQSGEHARGKHQTRHHARHRRTRRRPDRRSDVRRLRSWRRRRAGDVATDNRNRTVSEIRHVFSKNGGNLGEQGSVAWMFERKSQIVIDKEKADEDQLMNLVLEAGAEDLRDDGDNGKSSPPPEAHEAVLKALQKAGIPTEFGRRSAMVPKNLMKLEGKNAQAMLRLSEALEEHDDVQNVYSNFDVDEKEMEALAGAIANARAGHRLRHRANRVRRDRKRWPSSTSMIAAGVIRTQPETPLAKRAC